MPFILAPRDYARWLGEEPDFPSVKSTQPSAVACLFVL